MKLSKIIPLVVPFIIAGCTTPRGDFKEIGASDLMKDGAAIRICGDFNFGTSAFVKLNGSSVSYLHKFQTLNISIKPGNNELEIEQWHGNFFSKSSTKQTMSVKNGEKILMIYQDHLLDVKEIYLSGSNSSITTYKYRPILSRVDLPEFSRKCASQRQYHNIDQYIGK